MTFALTALHPARIAESFAIKWLRWIALLGLVSLCYWPGLYGGFVFDDDVNILQNANLRLTSLNVEDLWAAAWSGHAGPLGRPVALLTFAVNYYLSGADSFYFKFTNLLIHLANALLVAALTQTLCDALARRHAMTQRSHAISRWSGWAVAVLWALHPLNLTSVLYVVQRMTSLSAFFGLLALLLFARYRVCASEVALPRWVSAIVALAVLACLTLSTLSKETGLLFLLLLVWVEYGVFGFRYDGRAARPLRFDLRNCSIALVAGASAYVVLIKLPTMLAPAAFANRDFGLTERVLTEGRVLFFYLRMFLLPRSAELSLYHDDFEISQSLWNPVTTATSLAGLAVITAVAWMLRKRFPALLFAWGWFLIAHALESTVFPLELVHEHRNYFATIGFLMVVPLALQRSPKVEVQRVFVALLVGYVGLLGFVTHVRSLQWSNNVDWALLEATNHPTSARANYELARTYMLLMRQTGEGRFGELSDQALAQSTSAYLPGVLPFVARIQLAYFRNAEPDPTLVDKVKVGLKNWPYYNTNTATLNSLVSCQIEEKCSLPDEQVLEMLAAALENPVLPTNDRGEILKLQAQYQINRYRDLATGTNLLQRALAVSDQASSRIMYAQALAMQGKYNEALGQLDAARTLDGVGIYRRQIERERDTIYAARAK